MLGDGHQNPHKKKNFRYGIILVKRTAIAYRQNLALYLGFGRCGVGAPLKIARVDFALGGAGFLLTKDSQKKSIKMLTSKSEGGDADGKKATCPPRPKQGLCIDNPHGTDWCRRKEKVKRI